MYNLYLRSKNNVYNIIKSYYLVLIPLILFGMYKNGILLYNKELITITKMITILILPIITVGIGLLIEFIFNRNYMFESFLPLYLLLLVMALPQVNMMVMIILVIICGLLLKLLMKIKIKVNQVALLKLTIILIFSLMSINNYSNVYESLNIVNYTFLDKLLGYNVGSIYGTSIIFMLVSYLYLNTQKTYKKEIPFFILLTYFGLLIIYAIFVKDLNIITKSLLNSNLFFGIIFIAPLNNSSPLKIKNQILSGILIGILTFGLSFILKNESIYLSILVVSLLNNLKINQKRQKM